MIETGKINQQEGRSYLSKLWLVDPLGKGSDSPVEEDLEDFCFETEKTTWGPQDSPEAGSCPDAGLQSQDGQLQEGEGSSFY